MHPSVYMHDKKFAKLRARQRKDKLDREFIMDAVINRSSRDITENEHRVLARGFKFRPSLKTIPIEEYIIATESILKTAKLTDEEATRLRVTVALELERMQRLEKRRPTKPNMTAKEWAAVKELQKDEKITIVSADKGDNSVVMDYIHDGIELEEGKPVIMDYPTYQSKLADRIRHHTKIESDPAPAHEKILNSTLKRMKSRKATTASTKTDKLILRRGTLKECMTEGAIPGQHKTPQI